MSEGDFESIIVSDRGTLTLPVKMRKRLGLKRGDVLQVEERDGAVILHPTVTLPVRWYTDAEIARWTQASRMTPDQKRRWDAWKKKTGL